VAKIRVPAVLHGIIDSPKAAESAKVTHLFPTSAQTHGISLSPNRQREYTREECHEIALGCQVSGFGIGAIVARRNRATAMFPASWGIVSGLTRFPPHIADVPYCPLDVRWITSGTTLPMWPDELYLIHQSLDDITLRSILESQEE